MIRVAPSILAADPLNFEAEIDKIVDSGADFVHFDVMDGRFVPAITFGQGLLKAASKKPIPMDVHFMIESPIEQVESFAQAGARIITVHWEAANFQTAQTLQKIRNCGCLAGLSVKPYTDVSALSEFLPLCDLILIMTVEPGKGGQKLIPFTLEKVKAVKEMCGKAGVSPLIEVDGGINAETAAQAVSAGADTLVAGSAFFKANDAKAFVSELKKLG